MAGSFLQGKARGRQCRWRAVHGRPEIVPVVAPTMAVVVISGGMIGISFSFLRRTIGIDPESVSAPPITSICDGTGVLIYFLIISPVPAISRYGESQSCPTASHSGSSMLFDVPCRHQSSEDLQVTFTRRK